MHYFETFKDNVIISYVFFFNIYRCFERLLFRIFHLRTQRNDLACGGLTFNVNSPTDKLLGLKCLVLINDQVVPQPGQPSCAMTKLERHSERLDIEKCPVILSSTRTERDLIYLKLGTIELKEHQGS